MIMPEHPKRCTRRGAWNLRFLSVSGEGQGQGRLRGEEQRGFLTLFLRRETLKTQQACNLVLLAFWRGAGRDCRDFQTYKPYIGRQTGTSSAYGIRSQLDGCPSPSPAASHDALEKVHHRYHPPGDPQVLGA